MNKKKFVILLALLCALTSTAIALVSSRENSAAANSKTSQPATLVERPNKQRVALTDSSSNVITRKAPLPAHNNATTPAGQNESQGSIEVEVVMATSDGFEPAVVTRPPGPFVLAVHNRSGAGELVLRLVRVRDGERYEWRLRRGRRRHHQRLELPPGEYILSEAANPAWRCRILLTQ